MPCHLKFTFPEDHVVDHAIPGLGLQKDNVGSCDSNMSANLKVEEGYVPQPSEKNEILKQKIYSFRDDNFISPLTNDNASSIHNKPTSGSRQSRFSAKTRRSETSLSSKTDTHDVRRDYSNVDNRQQEDIRLEELKSMSEPREESTSKREESKMYTREKAVLKPLNLRILNSSLGKTKVVSVKTVLQPSFPILPSIWMEEEQTARKKSLCNNSNLTYKNKVVRGQQKWIDYPVPQRDIGSGMELLSTSSMQSSIGPLEEDVKSIKKKDSLLQVVDEWRMQWFLEKNYDESSPAQLIAAMQSINDHTRLAAVSACSWFFRNYADKDEGQRLDTPFGSAGSDTTSGMINEDVIGQIKELLDDVCNEVRIAAAISLFTIDQATQKAANVLLGVLRCGGPPDRWAAAQCLAAADHTEDAVLNELLRIVDSADITKSIKAAKLLAKLSGKTGSIQYMLAEQLNSSRWKDRVTSCHLLAVLEGCICKDIAIRLSHLMWNDWSREVRVAAARTLGRTGNGKLVHDKLRERLINGKESVKVEALRKIANLGIITGRLVPHILQCLEDDYVSVRMEAIKACTTVKLYDEDAVDILVRRASEDRCWKVKAFAIKAIGQIGHRTESVRSTLLWALHYEEKPAVRAEACNALCCLKYTDEDTINILQERVLVEESKLVRREVYKALMSLGSEPKKTRSMDVTVQMEVKRLCKRGNVVKRILEDEDTLRYLMNYERYMQSVDKEDDKQATTDEEFIEDDVLDNYTLQEPVKEPAWLKALVKEIGSPQDSEDGLFSLVRQKSIFDDVDLQDDSSESDGSVAEETLAIENVDIKA